MRLRSLAALALAIGSFTSGCLITTSDGSSGTTKPTGPGTVRATWAINGATNPADCTARGATQFNIAFGGNTYQQACGTFSTSIPAIASGTYSAEMWLSDATGADVTTHASNSFTVSSGVTTTVPALFPESSFLVRDGTVTFQWSMSGSFDASACRSRGVTEIRIDISGSKSAQFTQTCPASDGTLSGRFNLPAGTYSASATLYRGSTPATTAATNNTTVTAGGTSTLDFEFPDTSFF